MNLALQRAIAFGGCTVFAATVMAQTTSNILVLQAPGVLAIDGQPISNGTFTLGSFAQFDSDGVITDFTPGLIDPTSTMTIGSPAQHVFRVTTTPPDPAPVVAPSSSFGIYDFTFDPVAPDLGPIGGNIISAAADFTVFLPLSAADSGFGQATDVFGNTFFSASPFQLSDAQGGAASVDLFGDGSLFAITDTPLLDPILFADHGSAMQPTPGVAAAFGAAGLVAFRRRRR